MVAKKYKEAGLVEKVANKTLHQPDTVETTMDVLKNMKKRY